MTPRLLAFVRIYLECSGKPGGLEHDRIGCLEAAAGKGEWWELKPVAVATRDN